MSGAIVPHKQKMKEFRTTLARMGPQLAMAAPDHIKSARMQRMCMTVVQQNPKLLDCNRASLLGAIMTAAQLGLYPDVSVLGHAYFAPFSGKVVFIAGYKGLIDLAGRGGMVTSIMAYAVYEGDFFEYEYGLNPTLKHKPSEEPQAERELTHVYAIARIRGEPIAQFIVLSKEQVDAVMRQSPARGSGPWKTHYEPMAIKSAIRRLVKYLPVSSELQRAVGLDEHADVGLDQGLGAVGEATIEGLLPEDEITIDADYEVEKDGETEQGDLDKLAETKDSSPDAYTQLWAKGNDLYGDDEWKKVITGIRKEMKVGSTKFGNLPVVSRDEMLKSMEAAIEKGG